MNKHYDILVVGSGAAGLSFALKAAEYAKVCIISKDELATSNTYYAQGGICSVTYEPDTFEKHLKDTMVAGDGLCDEEVVRRMINQAPTAIKELQDWGVNFDLDKEGKIDLHKEGGHSEFRILHTKDITGKEIESKLVDRVRASKNIDVFENHFVVDVITQHQLGRVVYRWNDDIECYGVYVLNPKSQKVQVIQAKVTVLATGGIGNIYKTTTNPSVATGDGIAMAYRAKAIIQGMEFVQFHPTALYNPEDNPAFLITEAMRGFGAVLRTQGGVEFMHKYDSRGSLAPRDIVARAIDNEMKNRGEDFVYLDVRSREVEDIKTHFPNIYEKCQSIGIDIAHTMIPVAPAAHYLCGGIKVNQFGESSINRLYAIGECACTGLHGANRLASNSLMEAVIAAANASERIKDTYQKYPNAVGIPPWNDEGTSLPEEMILITQSKRELEQIMSNYVGIVRSNLRLQRALDRLNILYRETEHLFDLSTVSKEICELRNSINVGYLVIKMAQDRKESRGLHFTLDYPEKGPVFM